MGHEGGGSGGALRELLAVFGFGVDTKDLEHGESKLNEFFEKVSKVGEAVAAAFAVEQLFEFAEGQARVITATEHMAAQLGISTEAVQQWQYAAQASGFEADKFTTAMSRLQVAAGSEHGAKAFSELGIGIKDANGHAKTADALFTDVAAAIEKTEDPNKRAAIATKLFGRAGRELLPFLAEGREGIEELTERFKKYGEVITEKDIKKTKDFEGAHADMGEAFKSLKLIVARELLPIFKRLMIFTADLVKGFSEMVKNSSLVEAALVVLGAAASVFAVQMGIASWPVLLIAAAFAALVLLVDELITLFKGGDTLIGDWIDEAFGKGQSTEMVKELKNLWHEVADFVKAAYEWAKKHTEEIRTVAGIVSTLSPLGLTMKAGKLIGQAGTAIGEKLGMDTGDAIGEGDAAYTGKQDNTFFGPSGPYAKSSRAPSDLLNSFSPTWSPDAAAAPGGGVIRVENTVILDGHVIDKRVDSRAAHRNRAHADSLPRGGDQ